MKTKIELFIEEKQIGGYQLAIRNNWNKDIARIFVDKATRNRYLDEIGEKIITEDQFMDWYCAYKQKQLDEKESKENSN